MLTDDDPIAFVPTSKPEVAKQFYRDTLGLRLVADDPFAIVFDLHGAMLRVEKVETFQPLPFTILGWKVRDVARTVAGLTERGVRFERYDGIVQDERGVWTAPGGARIAWFKDPEGNTLSLTEC